MAWYGVFFVFSGFCSLVYEVIWLRLAMAQFGVTTPVVSLVVSMFMAGLGIGSLMAGRLLSRAEEGKLPQPLRLYGLAELCIAISAAMVPFELSVGRQLINAMGRSGGLLGGQSYFSTGLWLAITLLPWCTCMGLTFPLAMAAIRTAFPQKAARSFSYLYLANVFGAGLGCVLSAFVLIELFGFQTTLLLTATLNLFCFVAAFLLSNQPLPIVKKTSRKKTPDGEGGAQRPVLALLCLTGFTSMAMEIVWTREFTPYLGNFVYTFAVILAAYLGATWLGSQAYRRFNLDPALIWILAGPAALLPLLASDPRLPVPPGFTLQPLRVILGIVPFCGAMGFLTPMLVDRWSEGNPARAGIAYATNIAGSIAGPLIAGFWLVPLIGEKYSLALLSLPLLVTPLFFPRVRKIWAVPVLASLGMLFLSHTPEDPYAGWPLLRDEVATVVAHGSGMDKKLLVNGIGMTFLTPITKMMAHVPLALLPSPPRNGLVICFGMGTTFRSMLSWNIPTTAVELVPSVPRLFGFFHADGDSVRRSPLGTVVIDDGRRFLENTAAEYDVIVVDPPPPTSAAGSSLLYSREFYALAIKRLSENGILQQWFPGGDPYVEVAVARALQVSFPYVRVFRSLEGWGFHFLASKNPIQTLPAAEMAARMPASAKKDMLEWGPQPTAEMQIQSVVGREVSLEAVIRQMDGVPVMEDDHPVNEYFLIRQNAGVRKF